MARLSTGRLLPRTAQARVREGERDKAKRSPQESQSGIVGRPAQPRPTDRLLCYLGFVLCLRSGQESAPAAAGYRAPGSERHFALPETPPEHQHADAERQGTSPRASGESRSSRRETAAPVIGEPGAAMRGVAGVGSRALPPCGWHEPAGCRWFDSAAGLSQTNISRDNAPIPPQPAVPRSASHSG